MKLLEEENIGETLQDIGMGKEFLDMKDPKSTENKSKNKNRITLK